MDIVTVPIGGFGDAKISLVGGKVQILVEADLLVIAQGVRAKSSNAIENAILDAVIGALAPKPA